MNDDVAEVNGSLSERYQALSSTRKRLGMRLNIITDVSVLLLLHWIVVGCNFILSMPHEHYT